MGRELLSPVILLLLVDHHWSPHHRSVPEKGQVGVVVVRLCVVDPRQGPVLATQVPNEVPVVSALAGWGRGLPSHLKGVVAAVDRWVSARKLKFVLHLNLCWWKK